MSPRKVNPETETKSEGSSYSGNSPGIDPHLFPETQNWTIPPVQILFFNDKGKSKCVAPWLQLGRVELMESFQFGKWKNCPMAQGGTISSG